MADALGTGGSVVSALDHRLDQAGLIAAQSSTLAVRTGVMAGPGSTTVVTGTSATGTMTYSIAAHHWVSTRGTADGVYLGTKEATATVATTAAPGSNSRIDIIWSKQQDAGSSISPDGSTAEQYGVTQGTAAVSPTAPTIPVGAVELARAVVAAGATSTNGAGVTITNTALQTVARGAPVPVRNQAERDALATAWGTTGGLNVIRLDGTGDPMESWDGATWRRYLLEDDSGWVSIPITSPFVGNGTPQVRRKNGALYFRNGFTSAGMTASTVHNVAVLPVGYRPDTYWYGVAGSSNASATARLVIQDDGVVQVVTGTSVGTYYRLDPAVIVL